jgi:hypothetical protein
MKKILLFLILLMPITTQTEDDIVLSSNWILRSEIERLKKRLEYVENETEYRKKSINMKVATMHYLIYKGIPLKAAGKYKGIPLRYDP